MRLHISPFLKKETHYYKITYTSRQMIKDRNVHLIKQKHFPLQQQIHQTALVQLIGDINWALKKENNNCLLSSRVVDFRDVTIHRTIDISQ